METKRGKTDMMLRARVGDQFYGDETRAVLENPSL
jgi:hypothetical protein